MVFVWVNSIRFDKTVQLIVANSGKAGVNGEHSPADAATAGRMFDFVVQK
jgi:hypothetical protein